MRAAQDNSLPPLIWRVLGLSAVGLLVATVLGIGLISAGVFDPRPIGSLQREISPGGRIISTPGPQVEWLDQPLPEAPFTVRLEAAHEAGEADAGYGLAIGGPQEFLAVGVSPLGYVTLWEEQGGQKSVHLPWQIWPHVRPGSESNEIWVDVQDGQATVRLNRELLWEGTWDGGAGGVGLYVETFGGDVTVEFVELVIFH